MPLRDAAIGIAVALVCLLAPATSASAECARVLWERPEDWVSNDMEARNDGVWKPRPGHMTLRDCDGGLRMYDPSIKAVVEAECRRSGEQPRGVKLLGAPMPVRCLPDTADPRGAKEK